MCYYILTFGYFQPTAKSDYCPTTTAATAATIERDWATRTTTNYVAATSATGRCPHGCWWTNWSATNADAATTTTFATAANAATATTRCYRPTGRATTSTLSGSPAAVSRQQPANESTGKIPFYTPNCGPPQKVVNP